MTHEVSELDLHVIDQPGPGPLTVLVHGTLDRGATFARCRRQLTDLHIVTYDRRGYGRSVAARPPTGLADHVADLLAVLDGHPAVVVGHSYGGDVALAAAVEQPALVAAVACWEPPMPWLPEWPDDTSGGVAVQVGEAAGAEAAAEAFFRRIVGDATWDALPAATKQARRAEGPAVLADLRSVLGDAPFDVRRVTVPVVVGHGSASRPHHLTGAPALAAALPDAELVVIDGAGHDAHASHPAEFADFVRRAVARSAL